MDRRCPNGHAVDADAAFCTTCGSTLGGAPPGEPRCPSGHPVAPGVAFCTSCGAKVDDTATVQMAPAMGFAAPPPAPAGYPPLTYPPLTYPAAPYAAQDHGAWRATYAASRPMSRLAVAAFIVSLVWLYALTSIAAIVLGVMALGQIKERGERGRGLAIAAIVVGGVGVLIGVGVLATHVR